MVFDERTRDIRLISKILPGVLIFFLISSMAQAGEHFQLQETWTLNKDFYGQLYSIVDPDSHIVGALYKTGNVLISRDKTVLFSPIGQGPNELMNVMAIFLMGDELSFVEDRQRIKLFKKKDGSYNYSRSIWLESTELFHLIKNGVFHNSKIFLAGFEMLDLGKKKKKASLMKVYNEQGAVLKKLINLEYEGNNRLYLMDRFVTVYKDNVMFLSENELVVHPVSSSSLEELDRIQLEVPDFYKPMPKSFYLHEGPYKSLDEFLKDNDYWKTSYSIITKVIVDHDNLIIQIRTCDKSKSKFAVLFYALNSFDLENVLFTDDLLLGINKDLYYFYANGNPGFDEEADKGEIRVFSLRN